MPRGDMRRGVPVAPAAGQATESWKQKAERLEQKVDVLTAANDELEQECADLESRMEEIRAISAPDAVDMERWITQALELILRSQARSDPSLVVEIQELLKGEPIHADVRTKDATAKEDGNGID